MRTCPLTLATSLAALLVASSPTSRQADTSYVGYLITTFTDAVPKVQQYLSNGNSASSFTFLNGGEPILASTVGTKAVRDVFLATNDARSEFFIIATGESHPPRVISDGDAVHTRSQLAGYSGTYGGLTDWL